MAGNSFGYLFKIHTFGESHGASIGVVIDGCPAGLEVDLDFIRSELARRRPGQSAIVTQRRETDDFELLSGVFEGKTIGTPITLVIPNKDARSKDYSHIATAYRPSHADFTWQEKYGHRDYRGGGRSSARETAARVAAGAFAKLLLRKMGVNITAYVDQVGEVCAPQLAADQLDSAIIEGNAVRCAHLPTAHKMETLIKSVKKDGNTVGGSVKCMITGVPAGWGEPVFDKLHADLAKAMLSINACKAFEYGSGFSSVAMRGSDHNDAFVVNDDKVQTTTNHSGGIQGGISNGMPIYFRCAFKPVATIVADQDSVNEAGESITVAGKGRHDPCVVPRAVPIVEAMAALVLVDHALRARLTKI